MRNTKQELKNNLILNNRMKIEDKTMQNNKMKMRIRINLVVNK